MDSLKISEKEIWLPLKGQEGIYEISSYGKIRTLDHVIKVKKNRNQKEDSIRYVKGKKLQICLDSDGYSILTIKNKTCRVARLVAEHFLEKPENASCVRYKNNDITDCRVNNLYWDIERNKEEKRQVNLAYGRRYNKNPKRRIWYKQREKHPDYLKYIRKAETRYNRAKKASPKRDLEFNISLDFYKNILKEPCYYCSKSIEEETGTSLDRIDNSKGYLENNVLPCCGDCNIVRQDILTVEEMKVAMKAVLELRKKNETQETKNQTSTNQSRKEQEKNI